MTIIVDKSIYRKKGARFVSANAEKKNKKNCGHKYQQCQKKKLF